MIKRIIQAIRSLPRWGKIALLVGVVSAIVLVIVFWDAIFPLVGLAIFGLICLYDNRENQKASAEAAQYVHNQQLASACDHIMYEVMSDHSICSILGTVPPATIGSMRALNAGAYNGCPRCQYNSLRTRGAPEVIQEDCEVYREVIQNSINQLLLSGNYVPAPVFYLGNVPVIWVCRVAVTRTEFKVDVALIMDERSAIRVVDAMSRPMFHLAENAADAIDCGDWEF